MKVYIAVAQQNHSSFWDNPNIVLGAFSDPAVAEARADAYDKRTDGKWENYEAHAFGLELDEAIEEVF